MKKLIPVLVITHWVFYTWGHVAGWNHRTREAEKIMRYR